MRNIFNHLNQVQQVLASRPIGLVTDVDGTISPIASSPDEAIVSSLCRRYLMTLVDTLELVAAISGRPLTEVMGMVGVEGVVYVGNHGLEMWSKGVPQMWPDSERYIDVVASAMNCLKDILGIQGLYFENKGFTASVHYRNCPDAESARKQILAAIESLIQTDDLRITEGRMVVELRPKVEINKGSALKHLIEKGNLAGAIYIGDDASDIDAFEALHNSGINGIAVGVASAEAPQRLYEMADYTIEGVEQVERLLEHLVDLTAD